ncbi:hypothetical protein QR680_006625 [Steinernema hermaphroditum]|uniref:NTR domain-containing protein n=1 Tax=Steinernema hermaphroditum TaxID=289476 RepID=A0AA39LXE8_9BILA|nr:hypothetical protein QR680_006625 [Steinernema hermaphroditum]
MYRTALLLSAFFAVSFGCNCGIFPPTPQDNFCRSNFVGVLGITSRINASDEFPLLSYVGRSISNNLIFKNPFDTHEEPFSINLLTQKDFGTSAGDCGVNWLEEHKTYLLNGHIFQGALYLFNCAQIDARDEWLNVPEDIKKALLDGTYQKNCGQK